MTDAAGRQNISDSQSRQASSSGTSTTLSTVGNAVEDPGYDELWIERHDELVSRRVAGEYGRGLLTEIECQQIRPPSLRRMTGTRGLFAIDGRQTFEWESSVDTGSGNDENRRVSAV